MDKLTEKGVNFLEYLRAGRTDIPEYEQTIAFQIGLCSNENFKPTRESICELLIDLFTQLGY